MNLDLDSWGDWWEDIGQPLRLAQLGVNDNELAESVIVAGILFLFYHGGAARITGLLLSLGHLLVTGTLSSCCLLVTTRGGCAH